MLSQKNRLRKKSDVNEVFKRGWHCSEEFMSAKIKPNQLTVSRFGFSIGLSFSKKAVDRNRLKRIFRALIKENLSNIKPGFDVVFFIKSERKIKLETKTLRPVFGKFLQKSNLLKK